MTASRSLWFSLVDYLSSRTLSLFAFTQFARHNLAGDPLLENRRRTLDEVALYSAFRTYSPAPCLSRYAHTTALSSSSLVIGFWKSRRFNSCTIAAAFRNGIPVVNLSCISVRFPWPR